MNKTTAGLLKVFLITIFIQTLFISAATAKTKRHLVIYGGLSAVDLVPIANNADTLVVENARLDYLAHMKQINPQLIILKYYHALGVYKIYDEWDTVNRKEAWFLHDAVTKKRLKAKRYGWYLMDNSNESWQMFLIRRIIKRTEDIFDGVFLDVFWNRFVNKFVAADTSRPGWPPKHIVTAWTQNMINLLIKLRSSYPRLIFINGAHEEFMPYIDGCMDEAFVHANGQSDLILPNPSDYARSLLNIQRLNKLGKPILVQSGSMGDHPAAIEKVFKFCLASYFLVNNDHTSFGFHPLHTYYFKGLPHYDNFKLDLGQPKGNYYVVKEGLQKPNLVPNGNFDAGLNRWTILSGSPAVDSSTKIEGNSILFKGGHARSDKIRSEFIPVNGDTDYTISASCKTEKNLAISASYKKLGLQGRFYDKAKKKLPGAFSLKFDPGAYDWLSFERTFTSPTQAAFYRIRIGFIGDGKGKGWIDNLYFGPSVPFEKVLRRDFTRGTVFVNAGHKDTAVDLTNLRTDTGVRNLQIGDHEGIILVFEESN